MVGCWGRDHRFLGAGWPALDVWLESVDPSGGMLGEQSGRASSPFQEPAILWSCDLWTAGLPLQSCPWVPTEPHFGGKISGAQEESPSVKDAH